MTTPRSRLMWAVMRDGELFVPNWTSNDVRLLRTRRAAIRMCEMFKPGSKHKWSVCRVRVTPIKKQERRR